MTLAALSAACDIFDDDDNRQQELQLPPVPAEPQVLCEGTTKQLVFIWAAVDGASFYRLLENPDGQSGFTQVGDDIAAETLRVSRDIAVHLLDWVEGQYIVEACNVTGCGSSVVITVTDVMLDTIGYFKASNTDIGDNFGSTIALSADGNTMAIGAIGESSSATGVDGDQTDNSAHWGTGAVYLFRYDGVQWGQEAYIKSSDTETETIDYFGNAVALSSDGDTLAVGAPFIETTTESGAVYLFRYDGAHWTQSVNIGADDLDAGEGFGEAVALSADGNTLAVGTTRESSGATGINGDKNDVWTENAGAAYVIRIDGSTWTEQAYVKASNTEEWDLFGEALALSADGNTLAVGAIYEDSPATGINGDQGNGVAGAGAVYLFRFDGTDWSQQAYIKASNPDNWAMFGESLALSVDGNTLAVGAASEDSSATGVDGDQNDGSAPNSGAVYLFRYDDNRWTQQSYIKASNTGESDGFGESVTLSEYGDMLAVGAGGEASMAIGMNGDEYDDTGIEGDAGAVYLLQFDGTTWYQRAYIKASNTEANDVFGQSIAMNGDGSTLAIGASQEGSGATGIDGNQADNSADNSGAVYVF